MIVQAVKNGAREAWRSPALTFASWLWTLALAAALALPAFTLFSSALAHSRESAYTLDTFNLRVLIEIFHYDRTSVSGLLAIAVVGLMIAAAVGGTFVAGGVVHTLTSRRRREFFPGAARLFWRYFRLLLATTLAGFITLVLLSLAFSPLLDRLADSSWEPGGILAAGVPLVLFAVVVGFFTLVADYARIRIALADQRSALKAAFHGCRYVLGHPVATFAIGLSAALAFAIVLGGSVAMQRTLPSSSRLSIALLVLIQQVTMLVRANIRIALIGAESELSRSLPGLLPQPLGTQLASGENPAVANAVQDSLEP